MFGIFRLDEGLDEVDVVRLSDQPFSSDCENTYYQRSACDLCRTQQHECTGPHETCDRCLATSSACTYTLSSSKGPGKKRLRKTSMAHPGLRMNRTAYQSLRSSASTSAERLPVSQQNTISHPHDPSNVDSTGSSNGTDMLNMFWDTAWESAIDDPFTSFQDTAGDAGDSNGQDSRHDSVGPLHLTLCPSPRSRPPTAQDVGPLLTTGSSAGVQCSCLSTMLELLEMIGARIGVLKSDEMEDLFTCLGRATDRCRELVQCPLCHVLAKNPVMGANLGCQLLAVTEEIVNRLQTARQGCDVTMLAGMSLPSPAPVPSPLASPPAGRAAPISTPFQYGRYTIQKRQLHVRLLHMLVRCHVDEVRELLSEFRRSCMQAASVMPISAAARLEDAQRLAESLALIVG